jgi:hypothetical protein
LTADPPPRGQQAPTAAASFVSPESATRAGLGSSTDAIAALRATVFLSTPRLQGTDPDIYYPAALAGITATHQDQVKADMLAFLQS